MSTAACVHEPCISLENINPAIKLMEYAVRGPLVIRAAAIEKELEQVSLHLSIITLPTTSSAHTNDDALFPVCSSLSLGRQETLQGSYSR